MIQNLKTKFSTPVAILPRKMTFWLLRLVIRGPTLFFYKWGFRRWPRPSAWVVARDLKFQRKRLCMRFHWNFKEKVSLYFTKFHKVSKVGWEGLLRCKSKVVPKCFFLNLSWKSKFFQLPRYSKFLNWNFNLTGGTMKFHEKFYWNFS